MVLDSKQLIVQMKSLARTEALPLDPTEIWESYDSAVAYIGQANAVAGQTIKALLDDGKYHQYIIQPSDSGYTLEEVGAIKSSDLKQYVMVVPVLPTSGQEQGILYINTTDATGSIWTGTTWREVFRDVQTDIAEMKADIEALEGEMATKAPIESPVFTGTVKVGTEEVAVKSYVEGLFAQLESNITPGIVDSSNSLPSTDYKAGQAFRVAEAGTYADVECEVGDLVLVVKDYVADSASNSDFMVIQANIDGAVTSSSDVSTVGEIVVFDAITGKVIKGSGVQIASLNDAIAKVHEHDNATQLATYDKTQAELLEAAKGEAQGLVDALSDTVDGKLDGKADSATTLAGYGITDAYTNTEVDNLLSPITQNLNTKVDGTTVDNKIFVALEPLTNEETGILAEAKAYTDELANGQVNTNKEAIDAINNSTTGILAQSKAYTDELANGQVKTNKEAIEALKNSVAYDNDLIQVSDRVGEVEDAVSAINNTETGILAQSKNYTETRIGAIPVDTTVKAYIDTAVGSGGTASAEAIATAKQEAIDTSKVYTDTQLASGLTIVEF